MSEFHEERITRLEYELSKITSPPQSQPNLCPECTKASITSTSWIETTSSIPSDTDERPYYDESGTYHHHVSTIYIQTYKCSQGHTWDVEIKSSCRCGWNA